MPSEGYLATQKYTGVTGTEFDGPNVDYINKATDIEVEKIADGAAANAGVILEEGAGTAKYTINSSVTPPTVTLGTALVSGDVLKVRRKTTRGSREVDFTQGSTLTEEDLDKATKQGIYLGEEAIDKAKDANDLYNDMSATYTAGTMPASTATNDFLVSGGDPLVYSKATPAEARTAMGLGSAATVDTGTGIGKIPVNTTAAALGSAAYVDTGTAVDKIPTNTTAAALASAAYVATGTTTGTVPVLIDTPVANSLPEISGANLTNLNQPERIRVQQAYTMTSDGETTSGRGSASYLSGSITKNQWHPRPLNEIVRHTINGSESSIGVTLTGAANSNVEDGGVGAEINFTQAGDYLVTMCSMFYRPQTCVARLVDLDDSNLSERVIIQGTTSHTENTTNTSMSVGTGSFRLAGAASGSGIGKQRALAVHAGSGGEQAVTAACRRFQLQFAMSQTLNLDNLTNDNILGKSMTEIITEDISGSGYLKNIFAWVDIVKIA